jgi:hypothetical protein
MKRSRHDDSDSTPPTPTADDLAASDAFAARFEAIHRVGTELVALRQRASEARAAGDLAITEGLAPLLDSTLPVDAAAEGRVAEAVGLRRSTLAGLRAGELDPLSVPPRALAILARAVGLDLAALQELVAQDRARLGMGTLAGARDADATIGAEDGMAAVREAWEREAEDEPPRA